MLGGADAPGGAVEDDADGSRGHGAMVPSTADATQASPAVSSKRAVRAGWNFPPPFDQLHVALRIACQIRCGVNGMSRCAMPQGLRASITALAMVGIAPVVPASPAPLAPSGFVGDGTGRS